jgi:hypothetical protein
MKQAIKKFYVCPKCKGTGYFACYAHVWFGNCFLCGGSGRIKTGLYRKYTEAKLYLANIHNSIAAWDKELEYKNTRIESRKARNVPVHPAAWTHIEEIEKMIIRARRYWIINKNLIKQYENRFKFVD